MSTCLSVLVLDVGTCTPERGDPMHEVQHISVYIARRPAEVYEFASDPRNLPRWAAGLARSEVRRDGDQWVADAPFGKVRVRFEQLNPFGVMDHDVTLESGVIIHNPMRVVPNGEGSEFVFTLIRQPGMSDEEFARDRAAVERDLHALKTRLEREPVALETEGRAIRWARLYDLGTTLLSFGRLSALHRRVVDLARIAPGERILDVGCGPGRLALAAAAVTGSAGEACGIDPAPEMIALARRTAAQRAVRARFDVGVIEALPYPDQRFDVVLSSLMLHHLPDDLKRRGLAEIHRVLKVDGRIVAV